MLIRLGGGVKPDHTSLDAVRPLRRIGVNFSAGGPAHTADEVLNR
jgi:hypothetical protein